MVTFRAGHHTQAVQKFNDSFQNSMNSIMILLESRGNRSIKMDANPVPGSVRGFYPLQGVFFATGVNGGIP